MLSRKLTTTLQYVLNAISVPFSRIACGKIGKLANGPVNNKWLPTVICKHLAIRAANSILETKIDFSTMGRKQKSRNLDHSEDQKSNVKDVKQKLVNTYCVH